MSDTELTDRLRDAFALPHEPRPGRDARESLVTRLPRYRNRRRSLVGGSFGAAAVVVALVLVLALGGFSSGPPTQPTLSLADLQCAEVQIGGAAAHCEGRIVLHQAALNSRSFSSAQAAPASGVRTVKVAPGSRITVSLPKRSGVIWSSVTLNSESANGPAGSGTTTLTTSPGLNGRTVAVIDHAPVGGYTLIALATPPCPSGQACSTEGLSWDIELLVD